MESEPFSGISQQARVHQSGSWIHQMQYLSILALSQAGMVVWISPAQKLPPRWWLMCPIPVTVNNPKLDWKFFHAVKCDLHYKQEREHIPPANDHKVMNPYWKGQQTVCMVYWKRQNSKLQYLVAALKGWAHYTHISDALKAIIHTPICCLHYHLWSHSHSLQKEYKGMRKKRKSSLAKTNKGRESYSDNPPPE